MTADAHLQTPAAPTLIGIVDATRAAKQVIAEMTEQAIDSVARCERSDTGWTVEIDVIESRARLDNDDLLTSYLVELSADGQVLSYRRAGRRRRFEDSAAA